jgi:hypothetical protein
MSFPQYCRPVSKKEAGQTLFGAVLHLLQFDRQRKNITEYSVQRQEFIIFAV